MPEDQQQQATVAGFIPAPLRGLDQPFNLVPGEVLALAVGAGRCLVFLAFAPVHHFVESFSGRMPWNPHE
jgi:hypothetical protein